MCLCSSCPAQGQALVSPRQEGQSSEMDSHCWVRGSLFCHPQIIPLSPFPDLPMPSPKADLELGDPQIAQI